MMKRKLLSLLGVMGALSLIGFCLPSCTPELDVRQDYSFSLSTLPVQKDIVKGAVAEIRCALSAEGDFKDTRYTIRYFQPDGKGELRLDNGTLLSPNDRYPLIREEFRLYYTSLSADQQTIDVYIEDSFGKVQQLTFAFNNKKAEEDKKKDG
jgi:conjugative transposon protein traQ